MVSVRSLTRLRNSRSKSTTGSAAVRSTGSPNSLISLSNWRSLRKSLTASARLPSDSIGVLYQLWRIELDTDAAALLAGAAARLGRLQRPGQRRAFRPPRPDQGADLVTRLLRRLVDGDR